MTSTTLDLEVIQARLDRLERRVVHPLDRFIPLQKVPDLHPHWTIGRLKGWIERHPEAPWIKRPVGRGVIVDTVRLGEWVAERGAG